MMIKCNLAVLMAERKMSIQDVADKTGLSRTTISALVNENGKGIQFDTLDALCELLGVSPGAIFSFAHIKTDYSFTIEETDEKVHGDDEGNAVEIIREYNLTIQAKVQAEYAIFEKSLEGELTLTFNEKSEVGHIYFLLHSSEFKSYLDSLPFAQAEHIKEALDDDVFQFISDLPEVKDMATGSMATNLLW